MVFATLRNDVKRAFKRDERRQARKTLKRALDILGPNGEKWIQGMYHGFDGKVCAMGAIQDADGPGEQAATTALGLVMADRTRVRRITDALDAKSKASKAHAAVTRRNDSNRTNFRQVKAYFKKALDLLAD